MVRIAYFGTDGCPGHHVIPIRGRFTEEDIKVIESVDCDDFYKVFDVMRFKIAEFKGWTILGIPASLYDHRPGSKTVIFIEGKANEANFMEVIQEYSFLKNKVKKLAELYHDGEWLATGKLNQDPPTNKEQFQFTLDKDDSSFVSENQARKVTIRAGNKATKNLVKTFRGKLFKKAFGRARRGKDISSFERQEKESGFNFLYNLNNGRMRSGHIIIDGIGLFKQIIYEVQH